MRNKKKIIGVVTVILLLIVGWVIWGNKALMINEITIKDEKIPDNFSGF